MIALAFACAMQAAQEPSAPLGASVSMFGVGGESCATALPVERRLETSAWIFGFWSALNSSHGARVGHSTDGDGVMAEIVLRCQKEPSLPLFHVVRQTYAEVRDRETGV